MPEITEPCPGPLELTVAEGYDNRATVVSPGYDVDKYGNDRRCHWSFVAPEGMVRISS